MNGYLLRMFGISLGLTLILELPVGYLFRMRSRKQILLMILVNFLTNPPAVWICWSGTPEILVEMAVVFVEALVYRWFSSDENWTVPHPVALSLAANGVSWLTGVLIQR